MNQKMFQVDAFAEAVFGGNPAAVLVLDEWLPDSTMQAIAAENNLSETAFVKQSGAGWELRWFTPTIEVEFCGHATLAAAHVLVTEYGVPTPLHFSAPVGQLTVDALQDRYLLNLPSIPPEFHDVAHPVIESVFRNAAISHFKNFENFFVELQSEDEVRNYTPDLSKLKELGPIGVVITAKGKTHDFVSRYFAPGAGIDEDPVTGSIHATLVPFWAKRLGKNQFSAYQASLRGGHLICELIGERVTIEGKAKTFMKAEIYLPL